MSLKCVLALFAVPRFAVKGVEISKEAVVTSEQRCITVIVGYVPNKTVPRSHKHILRSLVHQCEVVRKEVVSQQIVHIKVLTDFVLELVASE